MKLKLLILSLALAIAPVTFTGCAFKDKSPKTVAYETLRITKATVDSATDAFIDFDIMYGVKTEDRKKVAELHDKFQVAFVFAVYGAQNDYSSTTPEEVRKLSTDLINLIVSLTRK